MRKFIGTTELYADDNRGIYIPQYFAESCAEGWQGIKDEDREILLAGPEHELYWDAWCDVLDNARYTDHRGTWTLWQDGDLWVVCNARNAD